MLLRFAERIRQANMTQRNCVVISHGAFPATCGSIIGPFERKDYSLWGKLLARWGVDFLNFML